MRITVRRTGNAVSGLAHDLEQVPAKIASEGNAIVHQDGERLNRLARNISRMKAGAHGQNFHKRISSQMIGNLAVEVGPSALQGERYIGVDSPSGPGRYLDEALVKIRPEFHKHGADLMDDLL